MEAREDCNKFEDTALRLRVCIDRLHRDLDKDDVIMSKSDIIMGEGGTNERPTRRRRKMRRKKEKGNFDDVIGALSRVLMT